MLLFTMNSGWIFVTSKIITDTNTLHILEGHRKIVVTKTNGRKKNFFNECVAENYEGVTHERVTRYAECVSKSCKRAANSKETCPRKYKIDISCNL